MFQPDAATHTLRDYVRQRANLVRLSGQHIQRMQKALVLMNLKLTQVLGDVTGVTGLKIIRAILDGERDPLKLAEMRDRRCKHSEAEIATALDGRYRPEHVTELRCCYAMWEKYQEVIADVDTVIAAQLASMRRGTALPPLPPKPRVRGRKPHDPPQCGMRNAECGTGTHSFSFRIPNSEFRIPQSLMRSQSYLGAYLRRQRSRLGAPKAITATAHKLARIIYNVMRYGIAYMRKTEEEYAAQVRGRQDRQLHRRAKELGYELKKIEPPLETITQDGVTVTVTSEGEIVEG